MLRRSAASAPAQPLLRDLDQQVAALTRRLGERRHTSRRSSRPSRAPRMPGELAHRLAACRIGWRALSRTLGTASSPGADRGRGRGQSGHRVDAPETGRRGDPCGARDHEGVYSSGGDARGTVAAEALFREGFGRFVELVDEFRQRRHAIPELAEATDDLVPLDFTGRSGFHYTEMLTVAPGSAGSQTLDRLTRASRVRVVERDASAYLARLLEVNSTRLKNDFLQRLGDSRAQLEWALRIRLQGDGVGPARSRGRRAGRTRKAQRQWPPRCRRCNGSGPRWIGWLARRLLCHQPG